MKKLFVLISLVWTAVAAGAYDFEKSGLYYNIKNNSECYVTNKAENVASYSGSVTIPATVNYNGKNYSVTGIEYKAFSGCNELTSVVIPTSIKYYSTCLFMDCANLSSVTLPNNLTEIPGSMCFNCPNLRNITIPASVKKICASAFYKCTSLQEITLPNGLTTIEDGAFHTCSALKSIVLPASLETLGECAFFYCYSLESIQLNEGLKAIEYATFYYCKSLKTITLPSTLTSLNHSTNSDTGNFEGCESLKEFKVTSGNTHFSVSNGVLMDYDKTIVYVCPEGYVGSFTCPSSTKQLSSFSFNRCKKLTSIKLSQQITTIPANAFSNCTSLKSISLHEGITSINSNAFYYCIELTDVTIPSTVNTINTRAFAACYGLKSFTSKATIVPNCIADAFDYLTKDDCVLFVPQNTLSSYKNATGWNNFQYMTDGTQPVYIGSVTITAPAYQLNVGQTLQLNYSFKPERATETAVTWTSANESTAIVSNAGLVTGKSFGTAEIHCSPKKGNGSPGTVYIVVLGNPINSLSVSPSTVYIKEGETQEVNISILPSNATNKTLSITSTDNSVAYAQNSTIYGVKEGAAIIKYETTDGSKLSAQVIAVVTKGSGIDNTTDDIRQNKTVRKTFINKRLYIQKGNKLFDTQGRIIFGVYP